ncbi:hypothetical protein ACFWOJ_35860 [Streptomyces sp. NPDC058439]|uniref:hypothetical protein n=1 Tax=Streptomyces sp. NPDC058439 TaxID=3346500 RepID=UPI00365B6A39
MLGADGAGSERPVGPVFVPFQTQAYSDVEFGKLLRIVVALATEIALKRSKSNDEGKLTAVGAIHGSLNVGGESGAEAVHARFNEAAHVAEPAEDVELPLASVCEVQPGEFWYEVFIEEEEQGVEDAGSASFYSWGWGC